MRNNFTECRDIFTNEIEKSEKLINKVEEIVPDSHIESLIKARKGNYFLYEDILKNIKLIKTPIVEDFRLDETTKIINEINENFIIENIQCEMDELIKKTIDNKVNGIHKPKLLKLLQMINNITYTNIDSNLVVLSKVNDFLEILIDLNNLVSQRLCPQHKCLNTKKYTSNNNN
jgi:hypothetical protein